VLVTLQAAHSVNDLHRMGRGLSTALSAPSGAGARSRWRVAGRCARRGRVPRPAAPHACPSSSMGSFGLSRLRPGVTNGPVGDLRSPPLSMSASSSDTALANARLRSSGPLLQLVAREGEGSADDRRTRRKSIDSSSACSARSFSPRRLSSVVSSSADHRAMRLRKWCTTSSGTSCTSHRHRSSAARTASSRGRRSGWATRPSITWCSLVSARSRRARMARSSRMCAIDTL